MIQRQILGGKAFIPWLLANSWPPHRLLSRAVSPYQFVSQNISCDNSILLFRSVLVTNMLSSGQAAKHSSPWILSPWLIQEAEKSSGSMRFPKVTAGLAQEWSLQKPNLEHAEPHLPLLSSVPSLGWGSLLEGRDVLCRHHTYFGSQEAKHVATKYNYFEFSCPPPIPLGRERGYQEKWIVLFQVLLFLCVLSLTPLAQPAVSGAINDMLLSSQLLLGTTNAFCRERGAICNGKQRMCEEGGSKMIVFPDTESWRK